MRAARPDPAPSRLRYRMQRWMLTPGFRLFLRAGLPFCIVFGATSIYLSDPGRREALVGYVNDLRTSIEQRPEFMVAHMQIDGAGPSLTADIRDVLPMDFPVSSFELDIDAIREIVAGLDPVKTAAVRIRPGGVLQIDVTERQPAVVWRSRTGLSLLDATGAHLEEIEHRGERADLPLIVGDGADGRVAEALEILAAARPLGDRLRGLVRMGQRRWDVVLDRGQRILLPEQDPVRAVERVIALSEARDMLDRDVAVVDMRLSARPTLRMSEAAVKEWWRIREINGQDQE